jgi:hypothetical protein
LGDQSNKSILEEWLRGVDTDQRQDFLDNLEDVIRYAEQNNLDVMQAVNKYKELKVQKYREAESKAISRYGIVGGMVAAVMLIVALSLVLVVLAIERNTRPQSQSGSTR